MKKRILTVGLIGVLLAWVFAAFGGVWDVLRASSAVAQLSDDKATYSVARLALGWELWTAIAVIATVLLGIIWAPPASRLIQRVKVLLLPLLLVPLALACAPGELTDTIEPSQTAFVIPLEGASKSDQAKFMSQEFLEGAKVATKRIVIPRRWQDQGPCFFFRCGQWIPIVQVVKVDRKPVVREWVRTAERGTSARDESIVVESVESVDFAVGVNASASILEDDASRFLYYFAGKELSQVMDENVRGFVQSALFREFGSRTLDQGRRQKSEIFAVVQAQARQAFLAQGVTIDYIGGAEGLTYRDPAVQKAINAVFSAEQDVLKAIQEKQAQEHRNELTVEKAKADAEVLRLRGQQLQANPRMVELVAAEKWDGKLPQVSGGSVPFINVTPAGR